MRPKKYYIWLILQLSIILIFEAGINLKPSAAESFLDKIKKDVSGRNLGGFVKKPVFIDAGETVDVNIGDMNQKTVAAIASAAGKSCYISLRSALINNQTEEARILIKKYSAFKKNEGEMQRPLLHEYLQVRDADKEIIELLLENGSDINETWHGFYPLLIALKRGRFDVAETLIQRGADTNIKDAGENSLIHIVMRDCEDTRAVDFFKKYKFDFNVKNKYGETPLFLMIINNKTAAMKYFIDKGADIQTPVRSNYTMLDAALSHCRETAAIYLVEKGADFKFKNEYGITPLHRAAQDGMTALMEILISKNAGCDPVSKNGSTPLFFAVARGSLPAVELLIKAGANINARDSSNTTPFMNAVFSNKSEIADFFMTKYPSTLSSLNINEKNRLLLAAAENGNIKIIEKLIENGADINAYGAYGNTALHLAVIRNNLAIINFLIKSGADINRRNSAWQTPLHLAAEAGNKELIALLKQHGAAFFLSDKAGLTPDAIIDKKLRERIAKFEEITSCTGEAVFIDAYNKIKTGHCLCFKTYPKLHQAAILRSPDILRWLIKNGADCNEKDKNNKTAIEIAMSNCDIESFDILFSNSAEINVNSRYLSHFILFLINNGRKDYFFDKIVPACPAALNAIVCYADNGNRWYEFPLISYLILKQDIELLKKVIALGADCNAASGSEGTPMYFAINEIFKKIDVSNCDSRGSFKKPLNFFEDFPDQSFSGKIDADFWEREDIKKLTAIVDLMAEKGAKINCGREYEFSNFIIKTLNYENQKLIDMILENLTDINLELNGIYFYNKFLTDKFKHTPFNIAIVKNMPSAVKKMIKKGAELQILKNSDIQEKYFNPLELSIAELNFKVADILIESGAKFSDNKNENPFDFIVKSICGSSVKKILKGGAIETEELADILKRFIEQGYNINAKGPDGRTPLEALGDWDVACAAADESYSISKNLSREELHLKYMRIFNSLSAIKSSAMKAFKKYQ